MVQGWFPGSGVGLAAPARHLPKGHSLSGSYVAPHLSYRCGGSAGFAPASQFSTLADGTLQPKAILFATAQQSGCDPLPSNSVITRPEAALAGTAHPASPFLTPLDLLPDDPRRQTAPSRATAMTMTPWLRHSCASPPRSQTSGTVGSRETQHSKATHHSPVPSATRHPQNDAAAQRRGAIPPDTYATPKPRSAAPTGAKHGPSSPRKPATPGTGNTLDSARPMQHGCGHVPAKANQVNRKTP